MSQSIITSGSLAATQNTSGTGAAVLILSIVVLLVSIMLCKVVTEKAFGVEFSRLYGYYVGLVFGIIAAVLAKIIF